MTIERGILNRIFFLLCAIWIVSTSLYMISELNSALVSSANYAKEDCLKSNDNLANSQLNLQEKCDKAYDERYWGRFFDENTLDTGELIGLICIIFLPIIITVILGIAADFVVRIFLWVKTGKYKIEEELDFKKKRLYFGLVLFVILVVVISLQIIKTGRFESSINKAFAECNFEALNKKVDNESYTRDCLAARGYKRKNGAPSYCYDDLRAGIILPSCYNSL